VIKKRIANLVRQIWQRCRSSSNGIRLLKICQRVNWPLTAWWSVVGGAWLLRVFMALELPIWSDEMYSIWAARQPWLNIVIGRADLVHPPGYYVLLKLWMSVSDQLQWVRAFTLVSATLNFWLVWLVGQQESRLHPHAPRQLGWWWTLAYALSAYHILFDWQARMYSLVVSLILITWLVWRRSGTVWSSIWLGLIAFAGLWIDYAYVWFYLPLCVAASWQLLTQFKSKFRSIVTSQWLALLFAGIGFGSWLLALPRGATLIPVGIEGIRWMADYFKPMFFGPYFLGSFTVWPLTITMVITGGVLIWLDRHWVRQWPILKWVSFGVLGMVDVILLYSALEQPLFHIRSLQIIGLLVSFSWAILLSRQPRWRWWLLSLIASTIPILLQSIKSRPDALLINFYPWHEVRKALEERATPPIYLSTLPSSPSPLLQYGLEYVLQGKETLGKKPIEYIRVPAEKTVGETCTTYHNYITLIRACKK
jgi:hypothetical protein